MLIEVRLYDYKVVSERSNSSYAGRSVGRLEDMIQGIWHRKEKEVTQGVVLLQSQVVKRSNGTPFDTDKPGIRPVLCRTPGREAPVRQAPVAI